MYELGPTYIRNGEFDKILLRPVHPIISIIGSTKEFVAFGYLVLGLVMTVSMFIELAIPVTVSLIIKLIVFSICGAAIIGAINTIFSITSFWTHRSNEIIWSFDRIYTFAQYPIDIYSKFIKVLMSVIPYLNIKFAISFLSRVKSLYFR